ncbi:MAG: ABC transporter ATP-binding protein [Fimbriimonadales bacterium]|nr:ABC transporter ATP-binding protein [Fimbriimonadales bacterium]
MPVAQVSGLTVKYGNKVAVQDLSCEVPEGCVGLLGPNGAGKTTLIKALLGFVPAASGTGSVLGHDIKSEPLQIRMEVGLMPELDCHIPGLSAVEYVAYAGELSGMPRSHAIRRAHEVLDYCALGEARYRNLETYSTGMKQRAKLAQALVHGPKLLFLDEPTNGLDPEGRDEMLELIRDISHDKNVNVIVSSHLLPDIEKTCDYVIVMQQGTVRRQESVSGIRAVSATQWDVELREAVERFGEALSSVGGSVLHSVSNFYRIEMSASEVPASLRIFEAAQASGAQIRSLRAAQRSLEEAFMEAIQ